MQILTAFSSQLIFSHFFFSLVALMHCSRAGVVIGVRVAFYVFEVLQVPCISQVPFSNFHNFH